MERNTSIERRQRTKQSQKKIEQNIDTIRKVASESKSFFKKPMVKTMVNTIVIGGSVFGALYISKYFFRASAKMIHSIKEVRNAFKE